MATAPPDADEIRRKMAQIRRDLHDDVRQVVQGAEAATDWRRFIRHYPWASMGVALAVGYLIVPRRHRPAAATLSVAPAEIARAIAAEAPHLVEAPRLMEAARPAEEKKGKGLVGTLFGLVGPVAMRAAQGYALQFAEQWMAQRVAQQMQGHPDLAAAFGGQMPGQGPGLGAAPHPGSHGFPGPPGPQGPRATPPGAPRF